MSYIFVILIVILLGIFLYYRSVNKQISEEKYYVELKQKCLDLCNDFDYILNDILIYLNNKKETIELIKKTDEDIYEDDMKYYEIEGFIEDEIENIMGLIKTNKEFILNLGKMEPLSVHNINLTNYISNKKYYLNKKEEIMTKYEDLYNELNIGSI